MYSLENKKINVFTILRSIKILLIFVFFFLLDISADVSITQIKTSIIKKEGNTAFLECKVKSTTQKKNRYLHWYRQKSEEPLQRILYISSNENVIHEPGFSVEKYEARKLQDLLASLRIHQTQEEDTGLYYCACWDTPCGNARLSWTKTLPCRHTWEHAWAHKLFRRYSHIVAHMHSHPLVSPSKRDLSAAQNFLLHVRTMSSRIRSWCFFFKDVA